MYCERIGKLARKKDWEKIDPVLGRKKEGG